MGRRHQDTTEEQKTRARERARKRYERIKQDPEAYQQLLAYNRRWSKENPEKMAQYSASWRSKQSPQRRRAIWVKSKYKLTDDQYQEILDHDGICDACATNPATHIDHCHETGRFRGMLCKGCNWAAGHMRDDPDRLRRLASYLERTASLT